MPGILSASFTALVHTTVHLSHQHELLLLLGLGQWHE